jgi:hypothetical protein
MSLVSFVDAPRSEEYRSAEVGIKVSSLVNDLEIPAIGVLNESVVYVKPRQKE